MDLSNRRVLEVGCGHGGGCSFIARYLRPAQMTGVDLAAEVDRKLAVNEARAYRALPNGTLVKEAS